MRSDESPTVPRRQGETRKAQAVSVPHPYHGQVLGLRAPFLWAPRQANPPGSRRVATYLEFCRSHKKPRNGVQKPLCTMFVESRSPAERGAYVELRQKRDLGIDRPRRQECPAPGVPTPPGSAGAGLKNNLNKSTFSLDKTT